MIKSPVSFAYILVVLIWSTTPITIAWSSESVHPTLAALVRMVIAVILGGSVILWKKIPLPWHKEALKLYSYSAMGIFFGMLFVYEAATIIASGVISLFFGMAPMLSGFLANKILGEKPFSAIQKLALVISLAGLAIVLSDSLSISGSNWVGYAYVFIAVFFFCFSAVMVKSVKIIINPIATTQGALLLTLIPFLVVWLLLDGSLPYQTWQPRALYSILYLGVFGSFIGFIAYYYILQKLMARTVALITLMTPVFALFIGAWFNQEKISIELAAGASAIILGLMIYQFGDRVLSRKKRLSKVD